eukprot:GEMP01044185.1.p1 GENE.GEMP01044185.1~~GEMP01044185.1.p1  ORF type:complete len:100 (+),score=22.74 GEMP01044185.1:121-420(+)
MFGRFASQSRRFTAIPLPLTMRMDGLMAKVLIGAVVFFVPQDIAVAGLLFMKDRAISNGINSPEYHVDIDAVVQEFKDRKGLQNVDVDKRSRKTFLHLA